MLEWRVCCDYYNFYMRVREVYLRDVLLEGGGCGLMLPSPLRPAEVQPSLHSADVLTLSNIPAERRLGLFLPLKIRFNLSL